MNRELEIGDLLTSPDGHFYTVIDVDRIKMRVKLLFRDGTTVDWVSNDMVARFVQHHTFKIHKAIC